MAKIVRGKNDLWTTHPDIASMLVNPEDGHNLSAHTHKKSDFICPNCNTINYNRVVRNVVNRGFNCCCCSDGISYPERFVYHLLKQLNVSFLRDTTLSWSGMKRYDFYVEDKSLIIETHGIQHYLEQVQFNRNNAKSEKDNDKIKKEMAITNGIMNYIELDCRYSNFSYIKDSVLNSDLVSIYDLSSVDWNAIEIDSMKSNVIRACELYNSGIKSTPQISKLLNLDLSTVIDYLKRCADAGLCNYTTDRHKKIICVDKEKIYDSLEAVGLDGFNTSQVSACCNGKANTAGGYNWCFYDEYDKDAYVMKPVNKNTVKQVLWIETGKIYEKLSFVKEDGFSSYSVGAVCRGEQESYKGYHFKYV